MLSSSIDIQTLTTQQDSDQGSHLHSQHQDTDVVLLLNIADLMAHLCLRESWASYSQILGKEEHWTNVNLLLICAN